MRAEAASRGKLWRGDSPQSALSYDSKAALTPVLVAPGVQGNAVESCRLRAEIEPGGPGQAVPSGSVAGTRPRTGDGDVRLGWPRFAAPEGGFAQTVAQ